MDAPRFESRDPLSPEHFRNLKLNADQAIKSYDILKGLARRIENEPDYTEILLALSANMFELLTYFNYLKEIQVITIRMRQEIEKLEDKNLEIIKELEQYLGREVELKKLIDETRHVHNELYRRYHGK
jgi:hypothetical protein